MKENEFNKKMFRISCDLGVKDESCTVGYIVDMGGNIKIDWIKHSPKKEVKKMSRPYFETKVVKVGKEKEIVGDICIKGVYYPIYKNKHNRIYFESKKKNAPKGNLVNGENLDEIKFPCFCKWSNNGWIGMLIKDWKDDEAVYTIVRIDRQTKKSETYGSFKSLKEFIKDYNIRILKGKIIIYEEE